MDKSNLVSKNPFKLKNKYKKEMDIIEKIISKDGDFTKLLDSSKDPIQTWIRANILDKLGFVDIALCFKEKALELGYVVSAKSDDVYPANESIDINDKYNKLDLENSFNAGRDFDNKDFDQYFNLTFNDVITDATLNDIADENIEGTHENKIMENKIKKYFDVIYTTKSGNSMIAKKIEAESKEDAKEVLKKQMRASSTFDKVLTVIDESIEDKTPQYKASDANVDKLELQVAEDLFPHLKSGVTTVEDLEQILKDDVSINVDEVIAYLVDMGIDFANEEEIDENVNTLVGGLADNLTLQDIANNHNVSIEELESQLELGIKVETEHTNNYEQSIEIAMDHLTEDPNYYTKLATIESENTNESENNNNSKAELLYSDDTYQSYGLGSIVIIHNSDEYDEKNDTHNDVYYTIDANDSTAENNGNPESLKYINKDQFDKLLNGDTLNDPYYIELANTPNLNESLFNKDKTFNIEISIRDLDDSKALLKSILNKNNIKYEDLGKKDSSLLNYYKIQDIPDDVLTELNKEKFLQSTLYLKESQDIKQVMPYEGVWNIFGNDNDHSEAKPEFNEYAVKNLINDDVFLKFSYHELQTGDEEKDLKKIYNTYIKNDDVLSAKLKTYETYTLRLLENSNNNSYIAGYIDDIVSNYGVLEDEDISIYKLKLNQLSEYTQEMIKNAKENFALFTPEVKTELISAFENMSQLDIVKQFKQSNYTLDSLEDEENPIKDIFSISLGASQFIKNIILSLYTKQEDFKQLNPDLGSVLFMSIIAVTIIKSLGLSLERNID